MARVAPAPAQNPAITNPSQPWKIKQPRITTVPQNALYSFTPSLMDGEALEAIFVQREALAADLVERVCESALTSSKLHTLIIGARGIGKTHLVSLVYHRVQAIADLKDHLLIAWLREEEWGVTSFLDLLLRIFRALSEADPSIEMQVEPLYALASDEAETEGVRMLNELIGDRTLWLIAENLDDLFSGLGEQGQQHLRAFLQTFANCTILATSPRLFNGVQSRNAPFYGFFRPVHLQELTATEAQQLLVNIARLRQQTDLVTFLQTPTGQTRVKAVQHLAGGNPRIYLIFADFLTYQSLDELASPFMSLVDALTPYYQSRMQFLSPQQRKIVELLCEKKYALSVKTIAQRCFMTAQTASSQLKELREKGYVKAEAIGRESYYDIAEPLMRICLGVKRERGEPLRLMVDFLRVWYPKPELQTMQQSLLDETYKTLEAALNEDKAIDSEFLEKVIQSLLTTTQDPRQWRSHIVQFLHLLETHNLTAELGAALVKTARELASDRVGRERAIAWRDAWVEVIGEKPEFALPLRLLNTAIHYKQNPGDRRVLLELPIEERKILQQVLELED
jgi:DNA-binding transcriptional ArsR family regulator